MSQENKVVFETFKAFNDHDISRLEEVVPSCSMGFVSVKKYKVTIEEIVEEKDVYCKRIQDLYDKSKYKHHTDPLREAAAEFGYTLKV